MKHAITKLSMKCDGTAPQCRGGTPALSAASHRPWPCSSKTARWTVALQSAPGIASRPDEPFLERVPKWSIIFREILSHAHGYFEQQIRVVPAIGPKVPGSKPADD